MTKVEEKESIVWNSKSVIDQVFSHRLQPVFDQSFHDGHPTSVADETPAVNARAADQFPEQPAGVVHALVVPVVPVDENQHFGHAIRAVPVVAPRSVTAGRDDGGVIDQPTAEFDARPTRGHRRVIDEFQSRGRQQTSSHVADHAVADLFPPEWTPRPVRVKVQRRQRPTQWRHVGRGRRPTAVHHGVHY